MNRSLRLAGWLLCLAAASAPAATTTAGILAATLAAVAHCWHFRVSGICYWLFCTPFGCTVRTSTKLSHYNPDLVVSVYHDPATHPWADYGRALAVGTGGMASALLGELVDSAGTRTRASRRERNYPFRDADAIGHPLPGLVCPAVAKTAFVPYFQSRLDAWAWRGVLPVELLYPPSWIPGLREVGAWPLNTWGNLYPELWNAAAKCLILLILLHGNKTSLPIKIKDLCARFPNFGLKAL